MTMPRALLVGVLVMLPDLALAHTGQGAGGLTSGLLHPLTGIDHLLAMIAVGLLATQLGGRAVWALPLTFLAVMLLGSAIAIGGQAVTAVELGILASVIVLGGLIALGRPLPQLLALTLVAAFALAHGQAHGAEMPAFADRVAYGAGFLIATAALHGTGVGLGLGLDRIGRLGWLRYVGAAVLVGGIGLLIR